MKLILPVLLLFSVSLTAQNIPIQRLVDWKGARDNMFIFDSYEELDLPSNIFYTDGVTANDDILTQILSDLPPYGVTLKLPSGLLLFNKTIRLPSNIRLKGIGADSTILLMDLGGTGDAISIKGAQRPDIKALIKEPIEIKQDFIIIDSVSVFKNHDWIKIIQNDSTLITSDWAYNSVGQIVQIKNISGDTLFLASLMRLSIPMSRSPSIYLMEMKEEVSIECLAIKRIDNTAPEQAGNIVFENAANCLVSGVESENCTFGHVVIGHSANINIQHSYFHDGFDYGGNGRAYGVVLQFTSVECLIENNVFNHLRHSVLLQAGSNGNVVTYNYSRDPFWTSLPSDAAGDLVLHGNYVFANLFEQNICQNIVIDDSHGPNGPLNTFFRNRSEKFGIFFSADNSPGQNFIGNEITNTTFPYNLVNYTIRGEDQFEYGNNNKGDIFPVGSNALQEKSFYYNDVPLFIDVEQFSGIGSPNLPGINSIPALERWNLGLPLANTCGHFISAKHEVPDYNKLYCYPNPFHNLMSINSDYPIDKCRIIDIFGRTVFADNIYSKNLTVNTLEWSSGIYFVIINSGNYAIKTIKLVKI